MIVGQGERYQGCILGRSKVDLDIVAEVDEFEEVIDELDRLARRKEIKDSTKALLGKIASELENFETIDEVF